MIDLSAAATVATAGAVLLCLLRTLAGSIDAYYIGFEDGKDYATKLLMGDHGESLTEFIEWRERNEQDGGV